MITTQEIITIISIIVAGISGIASILWSKQYTEAKQAQIDAKDAQIENLKIQLENLREFSPKTIREHLVNTKELLNGYIDNLKIELDEEGATIKEKEQKISSLLDDKTKKETEIDQLNVEKTELEEKYGFLKSRTDWLEQLQRRVDLEEEIEPGIPEKWRNEMFG